VAVDDNLILRLFWNG